MFEKNWREIYDQTSCKLSLIINDFDAYLKKKNKNVYDHLHLDDAFTMEASFTS